MSHLSTIILLRFHVNEELQAHSAWLHSSVLIRGLKFNGPAKTKR